MTVCIASAAAKNTAIVMIADKMETWSGYLEAEGVATKLGRIGMSQWYALTSGDVAMTERILQQCGSRVDTDADIARSSSRLIDCVKAVAQQVWRQRAEDAVFFPRGVTWKLVYERPRRLLPLDPSTVASIEEELGEFRRETFSRLIVCGFDKTNLPTIFTVRPPEDVSITKTVAVVGGGSDIAMTRLGWNELQSSDPIAEVLYQLYDAKCYAEMTPGVGVECDAWVLFPEGDAFAVLPDTVSLMSTVFDAYASTPLPDRPRSEPRPDLPADWLESLRSQIASVIAQGEEAGG